MFTVSFHAKPHTQGACVCLAVTCHPHFWPNNWDLLYATVATWGWNGYWNKSQHRKLTLEKKIIPLLLKPMTFPSWFRHSTSELFPLPWQKLMEWTNRHIYQLHLGIKGFVCNNRRSWQNQHQLTDAHIYHSYRWVRTNAVSDNRSRHLQCVELFTDSQINYTADGMNWLTNMVQLCAAYLGGRLSPSVTKLGEMGAAEAVMEWSCSLYWRNWRCSSNTSSSRRCFSPLVESNHRKCHKVQLPTLCNSLSNHAVYIPVYP